MDGPVRGREFGHLYTAFILPLSAPAVHLSISLLHDPPVCLARHLSGDSILSIYIFGFFYFLLCMYIFFSCSFFFFHLLSLFVNLFICLSAHFSITLPIYLSIFHSISIIYSHIHSSVYAFFLYLLTYLYLSAKLCINLPVY